MPDDRELGLGVPSVSGVLDLVRDDCEESAENKKLAIQSPIKKRSVN